LKLSQDEYERATALITHATLKLSIERSFPELSKSDQDAVFIGVIARLAHSRGFSIHRVFVHHDEDEGE
jgi:hypothetical protein